MTQPASPATPLDSLRNVGPQSVAMLATLGIRSVEDLEAAGTVAVYHRLKAAFPKRVTLMSLYALEAGLMELDVLVLPPEIKDALRAAAAVPPLRDDPARR